MPEKVLEADYGIPKSTLKSITATASDIRSGKKALSSSGSIISGSLTDRGAWKGTVNPGSKITVPSGIHNGSGSVTAKTLNGSGSTGDLGINHDNWVNGHKARASANVRWSVSGTKLTLNISVSSWLEGNESGGGGSGSFSKSYTISLK